MWQKIKRVLAYIGTFLAGILSGTIAILCHRRPADDVGRLADEAEADNLRASDAVRRAEATADDIGERIDAIGRSARELGANDKAVEDILARIRSQQIEADNH